MEALIDRGIVRFRTPKLLVNLLDLGNQAHGVSILLDREQPSLRPHAVVHTPRSRRSRMQ